MREISVNGVFQWIDRGVHFLAVLMMVPAAVAIVGDTALITAYIIVRETPVPGNWRFVEEWSGYLLVLMVYFSLAYTLRTGGHISVDVVVRFLPRRVRNVLDVILSAMALAMSIFLMDRSFAWFRYGLARHLESNFPSHTPLWIPYLFIFIGLVPFGLALLLHLVRRVLILVTGVTPEEAREARIEAPL